MIGFSRFPANQGKRVQDLAKLPSTAPGGNQLLGLAAVSQQSHPVARGQCHLAHGQCSGGCIIELGITAHPRLQQTSCIDQQPYRLAAFRLVLLRDQRAPPGRSLPANVAKIVTIQVIA